MTLIYADYNSTSPITAAHFAEVGKIVTRADGNPSNIHFAGRAAKAELEKARTSVAALFGATRDAITFTSGATEANNIALRSAIQQAVRKGIKPHIVCSAGDHPSVLGAAEGLAEVTVVPMESSGVISSKAVMEALKPETTVLALIHVNNETGIISPVLEIAAEAKRKVPGIWVHVDAVQGVGKLDLRNYAGSAIDSAAAAAHKVGGFKGIGCLYRRKGLVVEPLAVGGGQERGVRPGTENLPGIISFGLRAEFIAKNPQWLNGARQLCTELRNKMAQMPKVVMHGAAEHSVGTTLNFHVEGVAGEVLLLNFDTAGIAVSSGSACSSGVQKPSRVLTGMGYSDAVAVNSVRMSFGEGSRLEDAEAILRVLRQLTD